jgi:N-acetylneuraminic acid mutarotase
MKENIALLLVLVFLIASTTVISKPTSSAGIKENTWTTKASMPTARAQLGVAVVNGKIYAIGGGNNTAAGPTVLSVNEEYDSATNTWTTKEPMPTARHSFGIAVYENKIYCIGGSTNGPRLTVNEVYDSATNTWETKTAMPTARAGLSANTVNGRIYLMGGDPGNTTNEAYDPVTDSWTTESQIPFGASGSASAVVGSKIYLFGGLSNRNSTQIFDPATGTWTYGLPIPVGVAEGAAAATSGVDAPVRIYLMGGETTFVRNGETYGNVTDLNQVYDPEANSWSMGARLPTELRFFGLAAANDTLYAMGGFPLLIDFLNINYAYMPLGYAEVVRPSPWFVSPAGVAIIALATGTAAALTAYVLYKRYRARYLDPAQNLNNNFLISSIAK